MGTGVSCVGERVYIIARKQGKDGGIGRGQRMLAGGSPGVPMRPAQGQAGPGDGMLSRPFGPFAIVRVLHMHPTCYNRLCVGRFKCKHFILLCRQISE